MKIRRYIFIILLCISYKSARLVQQYSKIWQPEPTEKGVLHFCKDVIKAINPKKLLDDVGDGTNDVVDF